MLAAAALTLALAAAPARPQLLVLGSPHFANPGQDAVNVAMDDILAPERQRELEAVVAALARFRPTKIALEVSAARDAQLNEQYRAHVEGKRPLERSEHEQIGFRLARLLSHPRVYAVDVKLDQDFGALMATAERHGQRERLERGLARVRETLERRAKTHRTIAARLLAANSPEEDALHALYLKALTIGSAEEPTGAALVSRHYERNLRIFANIARLAEPGDRILVIYGSGHGKLLRQFASESPELELVRVERYLRPAPPTR